MLLDSPTAKARKFVTGAEGGSSRGREGRFSQAIRKVMVKKFDKWDSKRKIVIKNDFYSQYFSIIASSSPMAPEIPYPE